MFWHVLTMFFGEAWSGFVFEPFTINAKIITNQLKISFFFSDRYLKLSIWYAPNWSPAKTAMELPHFHRPWTQNCRRDTSAFPDHVFRPKNDRSLRLSSTIWNHHIYGYIAIYIYICMYIPFVQYTCRIDISYFLTSFGTSSWPRLDLVLTSFGTCDRNLLRCSVLLSF